MRPVGRRSSTRENGVGIEADELELDATSKGMSYRAMHHFNLDSLVLMVLIIRYVKIIGWRISRIAMSDALYVPISSLIYRFCPL